MMRRRKKRYVRVRPCLFCQEKKQPGYKEADVLRDFISPRGRILARGRTGACAKHQRRLARAIKRARFLALLPFVVKVR